MPSIIKCPVCQLSIPANAMACGHCGRSIVEIFDRSISGKITGFLIYGSIGFIVGLIIGSIFGGATTGGLLVGIIGAISGSVNGFKRKVAR